MRALFRGFMIAAVLLAPLVLALSSLVVAVLGPTDAKSMLACRVFLVLSAFIVILNAHLSFGRPLLYSARHGGSMDGYKHASGFPIIGSVFAALAVLLGWGMMPETVLSIVLLLGDTGGCFAFLVVVARDRSFWVEQGGS